MSQQGARHRKRTGPVISETAKIVSPSLSFSRIDVMPIASGQTTGYKRNRYRQPHRLSPSQTMKFFAVYCAVLSIAQAYARPTKRAEGTGPYPAIYEVDPALPGHTVYRPETIPDDLKLPVVVWGNGACTADGLAHQNSNLEIASWGIVVIAQGEPGQQGSTTAQQMTEAIDYIKSSAGSGVYANVDASRIAAAGMSCGGIEAYGQVGKVSAIGIFNSGQFDEAGTNAVVPGITVPIFFFLGGPTDIAYNNGMRDYAAVSEGIPSWVGNFPVGHGGTYNEPNGGVFGSAAQHYFRWVLRGDTEAAEYFTGDGAASEGWTVDSKSLDRLNVTPI
ncbi:hypothetical protein VNI00_011160 [Paramarasmius palmivorus]|uniref:Uncharacterized protein n=1 Tax=Paramarasmius palmivorus TaxID=297713 RepID=A0AAW0CD48_9AGAR